MMMDINEILRLVSGVGIAGVVVWLLKRLGLLGGSGRAGRRLGQHQDRLDREARERENAARARREGADDAAVEKITNRPVSDDPAADLADRLYGDDGEPT